MQEKIILGIDPGTNVMGFGAIKIVRKSVEILALDVIHIKKGAEHIEKLKQIFDSCLKLVETHTPDEVAVEAPFFGKNVQSMLKLGRAQGVIMAAAMHRGIPVTEYSPRKIKQSITGNGASSKEQVAVMMEKTFRQPLQSKYMDATDGLAVALCHHYQSTNPLMNKGGKSWSEFIRKNPGKISGL